MGTIPQELSSLQLTSELVMVQRKKKVLDGSARGNKKKANAAPQADIGPGA